MTETSENVLSGLDVRQDVRESLALERLLQPGATLADAADAAGVDPRTLRRWLKREEFARQIVDARREVLSVVLAEMLGGAEQMLGVLREIALDGDAPAMARRACAADWFAHLAKLGEIAEARDLAREIDEIKGVLGSARTDA